MADKFNDNAIGLESPAYDAIAITPSDTVDLAQISRGIYVGTDGDVAALMANGEVVTFTNAVAGVVYPFRVQRINATNTTATDIVSLY